MQSDAAPELLTIPLVTDESLSCNLTIVDCRNLGTQIRTNAAAGQATQCRVATVAKEVCPLSRTIDSFLHFNDESGEVLLALGWIGWAARGSPPSNII